MEYFNILRETLRTLEKNGLPVVSKGNYELEQVINFFNNNEKIEEVEYDSIFVHFITYKACIVLGKPKAFEHKEIKCISVNGLRNLEWASADIPTVEALYLDFNRNLNSSDMC